MIVVCPQCQTRYQLSDEKIKAKGTKVRCPRCQNTFRVFPTERAATEDNEATEFFRSRNSVAEASSEKKTASAKLPPPSPQEHEPVEQPTVSRTATATTSAGNQEPSPFKISQDFISPEARAFAGNVPTRISEDPSLSPFKNELSQTYVPPRSAEAEEDVEEVSKPTEKSAAAQAFPALGKFMGKLKSKVTSTANLEAEVEAAGLEDETTTPPLKSSVKPPVKAPTSKKVAASLYAAEAPRPFGSETMLEIQQMARPKKKFPSKKILGGSAVAALLVLGLFLAFHTPHSPSKRTALDQSAPISSTAPSQSQASESSEAPAAPAPEVQAPPQPEAVSPAPQSAPIAPAPQRIELRHPPQWYGAQPSLFQDYLSQMASLPKAEKQKPSNRALIGEALILNGLFTGAQDQTLTGLGYSSGLMAANPDSVYGFYGISDYAIWKDDVITLADLVKRWPSANRRDPEFRLSSAIVEARARTSLSDVFVQLKSLLADVPDYQAAKAWTYYLALDSKANEIQKVLADPFIQNARQAYISHADLLKKSYQATPPLYQAIERKASFVSRAYKINLKTTTSKAKDKSAAPKDFPKNSHKGLPKASAGLISANTENNSNRVAAEKLMQEGMRSQKENRTEEAVRYYQRALQLNPDLAEIYKQLGVIYMGRKENDRALSAFKLYLQLRPGGEDRQTVQNWINSLQ